MPNHDPKNENVDEVVANEAWEESGIALCCAFTLQPPWN
eukprot:CAMPEP_0202831972 /NCGR_PEP_ID=MMETSP1389-20130828/17155_1 /ASSEMBLY_ACC=CAM_ASM_000865 /TAXON_ID=302021 /ORGANISM="Rhodomonas sp., Strain CCMP768" /LENGTH=38 /DNA_ID= /DNA_START= /DNA_END= /DNA_ORIENTATION=